MKIRLARPEDNEALCKLSRETPMSGEITVAIDRAPDYFAFYDLFAEPRWNAMAPGELSTRNESWSAMVAEDDEAGGRVVGVFMACRQELWCNGAAMMVSRPEDGRVHPDYQRRGLAVKMSQRFMADFSGAAFDFSIYYILRGNAKAEGSSSKGVDLMFGLPVADINLYQLSPYIPYREATSLRVETATEKDRDAIVERLADHYRGYNLAPVLTPERWDRTLRVCKGYGYEHIHVVRLQGEIVALAGLWDDFAVRRYVMMEWPPKIRAGLLAAGLIKSVIPAADPPRLNEPMRSIFLKHTWCRPGYEDYLVELLKTQMNRVRRTRRYHLVWASFAENDPYRFLMEPFVGTRSVSRMYYVPGNTGVYVPPVEMRRRPIFADFSTV